jgi:hypothetical protein
VQPLGVVGIDGGSIMDGKTRVPPRKEKVDTFLRDELSVSEKAENLVPEEQLGLVCVDVGNGNPLPIGCEKPPGSDGVDMGIPPTAHEKP